MFKKLDITGVHMKVDDKLKLYTTKKIGRLDRFVPRHARESAQVEVLIKDTAKRKTKKEYTCEVIIRLPQENVTVKESTINAFAAVDIVEAKLKNQLKKYKETHSSLRIHRRVLSKLKRRGG